MCGGGGGMLFSNHLKGSPLLILIKIYAHFSKRIEPVHEISNNVVCATNKASDQPAHSTRKLIRAFASRLSIL